MNKIGDNDSDSFEMNGEPLVELKHVDSFSSLGIAQFHYLQ